MPDDINLTLLLLHHDLTPPIGAGIQGGQVIRVAGLDDVVGVLQATQNMSGKAGPGIACPLWHAGMQSCCTAAGTGTLLSQQVNAS